MHKKSLLTSLAFGMLLLLTTVTVFAAPQIVGEVVIGVTPSQEFYIAFETETAGMSNIEYGIDGDFTHSFYTYVVLDSYHIHTLTDAKPGTTYTNLFRLSDWAGEEVVTDPATLSVPKRASP